ncbi:MlaD family protein (plasmid) [Rhodococcus pyridinivorans]|uniref:MlaD family protein n=1 Tax=Rhodococcus TaxID=1827 RepID=UPI0007D9C106|nr:MULTISPECIES: MlaD family protein [Rhodococcus]MCT7293681.1 MlaD family protein [Rhodococcus sp. PAE-6]QXU56461.1 MCE family protein [Rhodococcus sp. LW-XY12]UQB75829.1 MCE family protein [Rhodococcus ruber]UVT27520.1 MlaD family protein [Rhodococcus pyridinivorans]WML66316.1 MlaD family protein [Rhodococcus sp. AH-ZY2]
MLRTGMKLGIFGVLIVVLLTAVITAVQRPVDGDTDSYEGMFTDASGLATGDDVRMFGVAVGKVESVVLAGSLARVRFTVLSNHSVFDNSTLAIRYQNLTGQRYLDVQQAPEPGSQIGPGTSIDTSQTVPSFDITSVFNGLRPVLKELSPESLNQLTRSVIAVIEGDGTGIGPAMDSIGQLSEYATDRQVVVSTLIRNLSIISEQLGGRSPQAIVLLTQLANLFDELQRKVEGVVDFALTAPAVMAPLDSLLANLGLTPESNPDLDELVRTVFPNPAAAVDSLRRLPVVLQSLDMQAATGGTGLDLGCSRGPAELPTQLQVLISGQRVVVCQ